MENMLSSINAGNGKAGLSILGWFVFSAITVLGNKAVYMNLGFSFPISLTLLHLLVQYILCFITINILKLIKKAELQSERRNIMIVSALFCADIVLNNLSLKYVPISFLQTIRSLTPATTAVVHYFLSGKLLSKKAQLCLIPICFGVSFSAMVEQEFHLGGFIAGFTSCIVTAFKFVISSKILSEKLDAPNYIYQMAPYCLLLLFPSSFSLEFVGVRSWVLENEMRKVIPILAANCLSAFLLNLSLYFALQEAGSVTVSVAGNLKVALTICLSLFFFQNTFNIYNAIGVSVTILGCFWYALIPEKYS